MLRLVAALAVVVLVAGHAVAEEKTPPVEFEKHVRPLLEKHCLRCHGADENESGLRLDSPRHILTGGDRGKSIVAGKADESLLYLALVGKGDVSQMPAEGPPLSADEIAIIRRWIEKGAKLPESGEAAGAVAGSDHWSFQPIVRPDLPDVQLAGWVQDPLDRFVLARLQSEGLAPSPEADRPTLIRRLSLDLRGLPPSLEEVERFVNDGSPDAYERLVDEFLGSPHFGERWGRHWLDAARYADSNGFTIDGPRSIWKYRDWVIEAFNRDLPFDRFTIEQLAGDLLPPPPSPPYEGWETDRLIATGFHRNTLINQEGGTDQEQFRVEALVDRVDTTGTVWLGLTIGCAQCHQHKYDPISQREFYELFAILNNCDEPTLRVPSPEQTAELARLDAAIAAAEEPLKAHDAEFLKGMPAWEEKLAQHSAAPVEWTQCEPLEFHTEKGAVLAAQGDGSVFVDFSIPPQDTFTVTAATPPRPPLARGGTGGSAAGGGSITAVRLEALTHPSLPEKGPGRADNGNFVLSEFEVLVGPAEGSAAAAASASASFRLTEVARVAGRAGRTGSRSESEGWRRIDFVRAVADHAQEGYGAHDAIDGKDATGWAIGVKRGSPNVDREILFFPKEPFEAGEGARLAFRLHHNHKDPKYLLGRFRLSVSAQPAELLETPATIRAILAKPAAERTDADRDLLVDYYKSTDTSRAPLAAKVAALRKERDGLEAAVPTTMILRERKQPRETHIHIRGDFLRKGARVTGGVPDVLPPLPEGVESPNRLDLARWLVSPDNPLTARVTVNRFWQRLFGLGLVETENDFGTQGTPPSHPELLDWLAAEFMGVESRESRVEGQRSAVSGQRSAVGNQQFDIVVEQSADDDRASGSRPSTLDPRPSWSIKRILRTIATSATYRQSSHVTDELYARDPKNRLLARQTRMRLEAEIIRDAALEAGGLLYPKMHGPGVHPPQPEGIYVLTQVQKPWPVEKGPERYRRGMYIYFWRSSPYPMLPTFDAPEANTACTRRPRSNTPLQALTLANDAAFHEIAQGLAKRILAEGPSYDDGRLRYAFATCLARPPSEAESQRLLSFLHAQREHYAASATEAAAAAPSGVAANIAPAEAAAWTALARILLNLDEFVTRE